MSLDLMAPVMFGGLVVFLLLGYPVAFSLAFTGLFFGVVGMQLGLLHPSLLQALPERVLGIMANSTLLAIPFFTFMGLILERSGMAEDLLDTIGQLIGHDDEDEAGRDDLRQRARGGDDAGGELPVVAVAQHDGQRDQAHRDHRRGHHARGRREQRTDEDHGESQSSA